MSAYELTKTLKGPPGHPHAMGDHVLPARPTIKQNPKIPKLLYNLKLILSQLDCG
mgnify:CR=1